MELKLIYKVIEKTKPRKRVSLQAMEKTFKEKSLSILCKFNKDIEHDL